MSKAFPPSADPRDTIVVPMREESFRNIFLSQHCWYSIRIADAMITRIKYVAAYQIAPISAITHLAPVSRIEPYGDRGGYQLKFSEPAKPLPRPISMGDTKVGLMQSARYTSLQQLFSARCVKEALVWR